MAERRGECIKGKEESCGDREEREEERTESGLRGKDEGIICEHRRKEDLGHGEWASGGSRESEKER